MAARMSDREARPPWVLFIVVDILPGHADEFLVMVGEVIDRMRHEPSFITTTLARDIDDPNRFSLFEVWADRDEFMEVQLGRPYRAHYNRRIEEICRNPRQISQWTQLRSD
jgi:quinol monooxygenase YgiN